MSRWRWRHPHAESWAFVILLGVSIVALAAALR